MAIDRVSTSAKYLKRELRWVVTANGRAIAAFNNADTASWFASIKHGKNRAIKYVVEDNA